VSALPLVAIVSERAFDTMALAASDFDRNGAGPRRSCASSRGSPGCDRTAATVCVGAMLHRRISSGGPSGANSRAIFWRSLGGCSGRVWGS
jgi:hypothetical protein